MISNPYRGAHPDDLLRRRSAALERLGAGALVLPASAVQYASRDTERRYIPDRELYYLTGLTEPETVAVLLGGTEPRLVVFARPRDEEAELWAGLRLGPEAAAERSGADECHPIDELPARLPDLLRASDRIHFRLGRGDALEVLVGEALASARARGARKGTGPRGLIDPGEIIDDLRLVKDAREVEAIRDACRVTALGHRIGAMCVAPGAGEWVVEAAVEGAFREAGATRPGFDTIVGSGANGCVLHYVDNGCTIPDGSLVLIDAGAEVGMYQGDVTRTWPASGRFTPEQRDIYDLVDRARKAAIAAAAPGTTIAAVHDAAARVLVDGLIDLRVLIGEASTLLEAGDHRPFFPHQTSHWLGLDVHDPGDYAREGEARVLEPGMVFTVEPGLYFRPELNPDSAARFAGIGVRIEDDVVITETGCEVLTAVVPTDADEVQAMVRG
jgi:Xaa-Pro aminopeptidase